MVLALLKHFGVWFISHSSRRHDLFYERQWVPRQREHSYTCSSFYFIWWPFSLFFNSQRVQVRRLFFAQKTRPSSKFLLHLRAKFREYYTVVECYCFLPDSFFFVKKIQNGLFFGSLRVFFDESLIWLDFKTPQNCAAFMYHLTGENLSLYFDEKYKKRTIIE